MDILNSQKDVLEFLSNSKKQNRLSHAYMFEGPKGVGKLETALYFICMLWCSEDKPCLKCNSCKQILSKQFLNLVYISPNKNIISVEDINNLQKEFSSTALLNGPRFYIIDDADKMSNKVQNKLLKFIEEPVSKDTYAILLTTNSPMIIPTIKSRVITLLLNELSYDFLVDKLKSHNVDEKYLYLLPHIENSVDKCLDLLNNNDVLNVIDLVYKFIEKAKERNISFFYLENNNVLNSNNLKLFINLLQELFNDIYKVIINEEPTTFKHLDYTVLKTIFKVDYINEIIKELVELEHKILYNININLHVVKLITILNGGVIR